MSLFKKDPLQIISFDAYGTDSHFYLRGRALEDESINLDDKNWFSLIINMWKRLETDEIKNADLIITLPNGVTLKTKTDDYGFFKVDETLEDLKQLINEEGWINFEVSYADKKINRTIQLENRFPGKLLIPSDKADYGVISDIDDTILQTGVVSILKWRELINTLFKSANTRLPLKGAPDLYNLFHRGKSGKNANPIFYVSHSPWNLYRYLEVFLRKNNFPKGPILLRTFQTFFKKAGEKPQKQLEILNLIKTYPKLPFILIGDGGEHDADIYKEIALLYPDQILAIYLRSVNSKKRMERVKSIFNNYKTTPVLFVEHSCEAVEHAKKMGFI